MTTFHPHNHPVTPTLTVTIGQHIKLTQRIKPRSYSQWAAELGFHPEQFTHFYLCWSIVRKVQPSSEVYCGALAILSLVVLSVSQSLAKAVWVTTTLFVRILSLQSWGPLSFNMPALGASDSLPPRLLSFHVQHTYLNQSLSYLPLL